MSSSSAPRFTEKQGQYLAFIATYTLLHRRPPAEADLQRFFQVTPPTVHQMIVGLEQRGLISRVPGQPRSITVTLPDDKLPRLQPIKTSATRY
jgi:DNA-binding MarR family transcriptional regulator